MSLLVYQITQVWIHFAPHSMWLSTQMNTVFKFYSYMNQLDAYDCSQTCQHTIRNECNYTLHGYPINFVLSSGKAAEIQHGIIGEQLMHTIPTQATHKVTSRFLQWSSCKQESHFSIAGQSLHPYTCRIHLFLFLQKWLAGEYKATSIHGLTKLITIYIILNLTWNLYYHAHASPIIVSYQCEVVLYMPNSRIFALNAKYHNCHS